MSRVVEGYKAIEPELVRKKPDMFGKGSLVFRAVFEPKFGEATQHELPVEELRKGHQGLKRAGTKGNG